MSEIITKTLGKAGRIIIFILFFLFMLFKMYFVFSTCLKFIVTNLYDSLPWNPFVFPILLLVAYGVYKGIRTIARANQLFGYISLFVIAGSVIIFLINADYPTILPIMENGFSRPALGFSQYILATGDYLICFLFLGKIKFERGTTHSYWIGFIFAVVLTMGFSISYYTFFNNISAFQHHGHMLSDMAKSFRDSDTLTRLDTIVIVFFIIVSLFHLLLYSWSTKQGLMSAFNIKDTQKNRLLLILPAALPLLLLSTIWFIATPVTPEILTGWYRWIFAVPIIFVLPILMLILSLILKNKEKRNGKPES